LRDQLALAPSTCHQHGLTPVAEASVIRRFEELFQIRLFRGCQLDPPHRFLSLS
jgi:hypothetical protein